jgi:hypothetical protein
MENETHPDYVTVTQGISGWFAVYVSWTKDGDSGFYEPYHSGFGRYKHREDAETEAQEWAKSEGIEYRN